MDRRKFLATAAAMPAATMLGSKLARAEDHLKWAVFTPDSEVTFRTVMKPFAETVQRETNNAVVFDLFPNGALGRNPGQQPQMVLDGVADVAWVIPSYSPGRFPGYRSARASRACSRTCAKSSLVATRLNAAQCAQRLRRLLCDWIVGHRALFHPHQLSGQFDRRSQGQDHPRVEQERKRGAARLRRRAHRNAGDRNPRGDQPRHHQRHDLAHVAVLRFRARSGHQQSLLHRSRRRSARHSDEQEEIRRAAAIRSQR